MACFAFDFHHREYVADEVVFPRCLLDPTVQLQPLVYLVEMGLDITVLALSLETRYGELGVDRQGRGDLRLVLGEVAAIGCHIPVENICVFRVDFKIVTRSSVLVFPDVLDRLGEILYSAFLVEEPEVTSFA